MVDNDLPVSIGYARKQLPHMPVGLLVDLRLGLGDGFGCPRDQVDIHGLHLTLGQLLSGLLDDGLPEVIADTLNMHFELFWVTVIAGLEEKTVRVSRSEGSGDILQLWNGQTATI